MPSLSAGNAVLAKGFQERSKNTAFVLIHMAIEIWQRL